jgi:TonB family protein
MISSPISRLLASLLLCLGAHGAAQANEVDGRVILDACGSADYPREGTKYGLAGSVKLGFDLSPTGAVENLTMLKGTGWVALDEAAFNAVAKCQFPADVAATKKKFAVNYVFKPFQLNPGVSPPAIRPDTCPASDMFGDFIPSRDEAIDKVDGVAMRFDVDEVGRVHSVVLEDRVWDPRIANAALAHIEACRFNPSKRAGIKSKGATSGRLSLKAPK